MGHAHGDEVGRCKAELCVAHHSDETVLELFSVGRICDQAVSHRQHFVSEHGEAKGTLTVLS